MVTWVCVAVSVIVCWTVDVSSMTSVETQILVVGTSLVEVMISVIVSKSVFVMTSVIVLTIVVGTVTVCTR